MQSCLFFSAWVLLLHFALWLPAMTLSAAGTTPVIVRSAVQPESGIWVGQRVVYQLDVLAKDGWAKVQHMPDFQVSGAVAVRMETQGVRLNETINSDAYAGQRYELLLFPQRGGEISVPATTVDIEISQWGGGARQQTVQKTTPALTFKARTPSGAEKIHGLISTERLSADQTWEPDAKALSVGAAVERRVIFSAENVSAMAFAPLAFEGAAAFDAYPKPPEVEDRYDRGDLTARRTETVSYVFTRSGRVELPAVTITWFDLKQEALQETVLPPRTFEIAPSAAVTGTSPASTGKDTPTSRGWTYGAAIILLLMVLMAIFQRRLRRRWRTWRDRRRHSEKALFKRFVKAARKGEPTSALNALMRWLDRIHEGDQAARLDRFLKVFSNSRGRKAADALISAADPRAPVPWQSRDLLVSMTKARRRWLARRRPPGKRQHLPLLNPQ